MIVDSQFAAFFLAAVAAGGIAYVFLYPILSGERRAAARQQSFVAPASDRRERIAAVNRKDQVAQSLKELEAKQKAKDKVTLDTRIAQAGLSWTKRTFVVVSVVLAAVVGAVALGAARNPSVALGAAFAAGLGLPRWILAFLRKRRLVQFTLELPNAVDIIVRGIRSGLPLGDCLRICATETREPLKSEFRTIVENQAVGMTVSEAVARLPERVPIAEANFFAIVIGIQQKTGGNLSEALGGLSRVLRERRKMGDKIKAMSMEAKASAVIIGALPFIVALMTYLSSPDYISLLWTTQTGKMALLAGGFWMAIGIFVMKKMISFKF